MRTILLIIATILLAQHCHAMEIVVVNGETIETISQRPFPPFSLADVRVITPTSSTSKCLGNLKDPICAAETVIGCYWGGYQHEKNCEAVALHMSFPDVGTRRVEYIILEYGKADLNLAKKLGCRKDDNCDDWWLTKNTFQVRVLNRSCDVSLPNCTNEWHDSMVVLNYHDKKWKGRDLSYLLPLYLFIK